ncbi:MAG: hypothetical protein ACK5JN_09990 [Kluyvera sp.]
MTGYLIVVKTFTIPTAELLYNKDKGAMPVIAIQYLCPKCSVITEITDIEKIKNAEDTYPLTCHGCGMPFSKDALIKFARQKAEEMINEALFQLKNASTQGNK